MRRAMERIRASVRLLVYARARTDVVTPKDVKVANVEAATGDYGIRPGSLFRVGPLGLAGRCEAALFAVGIRSRYGDGDIAIFAVKVEAVLRVEYRSGAHSFRTPSNLARCEVSC